MWHLNPHAARLVSRACYGCSPPPWSNTADWLCDSGSAWVVPIALALDSWAILQHFSEQCNPLDTALSIQHQVLSGHADPQGHADPHEMTVARHRLVLFMRPCCIPLITA
eukprot:3893660-Pleurochrysis_carterae.AAC.1